VSPDPGGAAQRAELLRLLLAERGLELGNGITPVPRDGMPQGSFAQERMWFWHHLLGRRSFIHNVPLAVRVRGPVDAGAVQTAVNALIARHEPLRTGFALSGQTVRQRISRSLEVPVTSHDLTARADPWAVVHQVALADARRPFDLTRLPLARARLLRLAGDDHVFLFTTHHINWDGTSTGLIVHELVTHYLAAVTGKQADLPALPVQYLDWAAWQRRHLTGEPLRRHLDYWQAQLSGAPSVRLPTPNATTAARALDDGQTIAFSVSAALTAALARVAREEDATLFMVVYAAYSALMHRLTGEDDLTIGAYVANRTFPAIEPLIGYFVNCLPIRNRFPAGLTFQQHLARVRAATLGAYQHQALPIGRVTRHVAPTRERGLDEPLYPMDFQFQNVPRPHTDLGGLNIEILDRNAGAADIDLGIVLWQRLPDLTETDGLRGWFKFRSSLYSEHVIRELLDRYLLVLEAVAGTPSVRLSDLPAIMPGEQQAAIAHGQERETRPGSLPALVGRFARQDGTSVAIRDSGGAVSYRALHDAVAALAGRLADAGTGPEDLVAVIASRWVVTLAAACAALDRGAAFLLLDAGLPADRLGAALARARPTVVLAEPCADVRLPPGARRIDLSAPGPAMSSGEHSPPRAPVPDGLAQVVAGLGPAGASDGAMISHSALLTRVLGAAAKLGLHPGDVVGQLAGEPAAGPAVWRLLAPLACGAELRILPPGLAADMDALASVLAGEPITVLQIPARLLTPLMDRCQSSDLWPQGLRWMIITGQAPSVGEAGRWHAAFPGVRLLAAYNPGECAGDAALHEPSPGGPADHGLQAIGYPAPGASAYLLDRRMTPVAPGARAELYIGGAAVGRGYRGDPRRTAERFLPDPFSPVPGARMYRTGDHAVRFPGGPVELRRGTADPVAIDDDRIGLGRLDAELAQLPGIKEVAVAVRAEPATGPQLVACLVPGPGQPGEADQRWVGHWREAYDAVYAGPPAADPEFDLSGWTSAGDGAAGAADVRGRLDGTVTRLQGFKPQRVLEIGCGTGLLLWRLAPPCTEYHARDLSPLAVERVRRGLAGRPLAGVTIQAADAADFDGVPAGHYDLAILNSVTHCFPSAAYLERVISGAAERVRPGGRIFLGDLRSLPLARALDALAALDEADPGTSASRLRERVARATRLGRELAVDPMLFLAISRFLPRVASVQLYPGTGWPADGTTRPWFDAVLTLDEPAASGPPALSVGWAEGEGTESVARLLSGVRPPSLAVRRIPDRRWVRALATERALAEPVGGATAEGIRRAVMSAAPDALPAELAKLARRHGYVMTLALEPDCPGHFCALLRSEPGAEWQPPPGEPATWAADIGDYVSAPARADFERDLQASARHEAGQRLPGALVPSAFAVLDALPRLPDGAVNRAALAEAARGWTE
jgi:non-ribosomal peptide synthetase component F/SAM-dependent methyltransferase